MKVLVLAVLLVGCTKSTPIDKDRCRRDTDELVQVLAGAPLEPQRFLLDGANLVRRDDLPKTTLAAAPVLSVGPTELYFQGKVYPDRDQLRDALAGTAARARDEHAQGRAPSGADPRLLYLLIHEAAPWSQVVAAVELASGAGLTRPALVFEAPFTGKRLPRTDLDDAMEALDRGDPDAKERLRRIGNVVDSCPPIVRLFRELGEHEGDKAAHLLAQLPGALAECTCSLDMPRFGSVLWWMVVNRQPTRVIALDLEVGGATLSAPATSTWAAVSKQIPPTAKALRFELEPERR